MDTHRDTVDQRPRIAIAKFIPLARIQVESVQDDEDKIDDRVRQRGFHQQFDDSAIGFQTLRPTANRHDTMHDEKRAQPVSDDGDGVMDQYPVDLCQLDIGQSGVQSKDGACTACAHRVSWKMQGL